MIRFVGHLHVDTPAQVAFERLADMTVLDRWNPNVTASRRLDGDRLQVGSTYESTIVRGPMRMTARSTLTAVELGRSVRYEGVISAAWSVDELRFQPVRGGCRVTFINRTTLPPWLWPVGPLLNAAFQPQARTAVLGAQRYLAETR